MEQRKIFLSLVVIFMLKIDEPLREFWQFLLIFCPLDPDPDPKQYISQIFVWKNYKISLKNFCKN